MRGWIVLTAALAATNGVAAEGSDLAQALRAGELALGIRYRFEHVDQDSFARDANASTARLRLSYASGKWRNWSANIEFDHVFDVLVTDFNSGAGTSPGKAGYPVVADPDGSDLNQLYLEYSSDPEWKWRIGRQRILLNNQRFVGGVGWRQNEQTYDAISVKSTAIDGVAIFYSYIAHVRRIFGQSVAAGRNDVDAHLLNAEISLGKRGLVTPYVYYIDNSDVSAFSTTTLGARYAASVMAGEGDLAVLAEIATQSEAANAPVGFSSDYLHLAATWSLDSGLAFGAGFEKLGGDAMPGGAFRTPLATLHAFNGWADQFLSTPDAGLEDTYLNVKVKAGQWNLAGTYHDFSADTGGSDFGSEVDLSASRKLNERYGILLKAAFFSAESGTPYVDTTKLWFMFTASY